MAKAFADLEDALASWLHADASRRAATLDQVVGTFVRALAPFLTDPHALRPVQRVLQLFAGGGDRDAGVQGLLEAFRRVDDELGPGLGGFSRLLDNALHAGEVSDPVRLRPEWVAPRWRPLAERLAAVALRLDALDDLSHALSVRAELPAGALVLHGVFAWLMDEAPSLAVEELSDWVRARELDARLLPLMGLGAGLQSLSHAHVAAAEAGQLARPFALWLLAHRLAGGMRLEAAADREPIDALLERAALLPLEVFDVAGLWPTLRD